MVAPRLAASLGLPFLDRLVPVGTGRPEPQSEEGLSETERAQTPLSRWIDHLVRLPSVVGTPVAGPEGIPDKEKLRRELEASIDQMVAAGGGVLLGRAGAVVLAGRPGAFHIRLTGPAERRVAQAMKLEPVDHATAKRRQVETDRARAVFVQRLYDRDAADPVLYHLLIDSTAVPLDMCVDMSAAAVTAYWRQFGIEA